MNTEVLSIISSAEFWLSVAFVGVVLLAARPLARYLKKWGQERADAVQKEIDDSLELRQKAEALLIEYTEKTRNKAKERATILQRAREEVAYLQTESNQKLQERLAKQDEDIAVRLKLVKQHSQKEMKDKLLKGLIQQANQHLINAHQTLEQDERAQMDQTLDLFFETLDKNADLLDIQQSAH